ncbi:hypothetical protein MKJ04_05135 [Pontibacter sp. E15-1]|uniref:hypothetical protein n=1 Tax=Pontibacter sp. E15-1 TaxID=2919918 RepID=UPI001F4FB13F|nr:hypothetical protein [Pontibacter sp. E15-1]MCJ8164217.1 hypothetical protein [Pontibacter sp. E15-1]
MKAKYFIFYILWLTPSIILKAQSKEMFIEQISGKTMVRENFEGGQLTGKQIFTAEKMEQRGKLFFVDIKIKIYDEAQNLESVHTTTYQCRPDESDVLLSVFALNPKKQEIAVSAKSGDFKKMYDLNPTRMLRSLSLTLYIETGLLNFLGSKNNVTINNRSLKKNATGWSITESIHIQAYVLGFKIKKIDYEATEYLTKAGLLERQIFKQQNGDYFTITYN